MVSPAPIADTSLAFPAPGYGRVPPGWIVTAVTWLEMRAPPAATTRPTPSGVTLEPIGASDLARYRRLFAAVGEPWLWFGRTAMSDEDLAAILGDPAVWCRAVVRKGRDLGFVELDGRTAGEVELAYFGLVPDAVGSGLGRWLMDRALAEAWAGAPDKVTVHTCHFDHPGALAFYRRSGFTPVASGIELTPDPRLSGALPRDCAPHVPLIEP
ncbi:MAG: GNAT family N-acetyltransferase [Hyphomicrobiales bacterium]|nr:GNAT family N-acetyltransferase [Hyphomicrobiales bacterium]